MTNNTYNTMTEATQELNKRGFSHQFTVNKQGRLEDENGESFSDNDVSLEEFHRFEGMTNPADSSIIYALSTKSGVKGTAIDAYGADGSEALAKFLNKVKQNQYGN